MCQERKLLNQSMLINREQGQAKFSVPLHHPQHGIDAGIQPERAAAPSHPAFVGWTHIALNVGNKPEVDRMEVQARLKGTLLSPPRMTGDGFYEAVIADPDPNQVELVGCDLLKTACRSLYRVVKVSKYG